MNVLRNLQYLELIRIADKLDEVKQVTIIENILYTEELPIPVSWLFAALHLQHEDGYCHVAESTVKFTAKKNVYSIPRHFLNEMIMINKYFCTLSYFTGK